MKFASSTIPGRAFEISQLLTITIPVVLLDLAAQNNNIPLDIIGFFEDARIGDAYTFYLDNSVLALDTVFFFLPV